MNEPRKTGVQVVKPARAAKAATGSRREIARRMQELEVRAHNAEAKLAEAWLMIAAAITAAPTHRETEGGAVQEVFIDDALLERLASEDQHWRIVRAQARTAEGVDGILMRVEPMPAPVAEKLQDAKP